MRIINNTLKWRAIEQFVLLLITISPINCDLHKELVMFITQPWNIVIFIITYRYIIL